MPVANRVPEPRRSEPDGGADGAFGSRRARSSRRRRPRSDGELLAPLGPMARADGRSAAHAEDCLGLVQAVENPHLRLMLDLYHAQTGEGNLIELCRGALDSGTPSRSDSQTPTVHPTWAPTRPYLPSAVSGVDMDDDRGTFAASAGWKTLAPRAVCPRIRNGPGSLPLLACSDAEGARPALRAAPHQSRACGSSPAGVGAGKGRNRGC